MRHYYQNSFISKKNALTVNNGSVVTDFLACYGRLKRKAIRSVTAVVKVLANLSIHGDTVNLRVKTALPLVVKLHDAVMLKLL